MREIESNPGYFGQKEDVINKKILIIDYEKESLNPLVDLLQSKGFQTNIARNGTLGLKEFENENPDLVIMEALLPKFHGFDLCKKITTEYDRKVPVIILTKIYTEGRYKNEAIKTYGASAYFKKPFQNKEFLETVFSLLGIEDEEKIEKVTDAKRKETSEEPHLLNKKKQSPEPHEEKIKEDKKPLPQIGEYSLLEKIGSGGMGEVYKAVKKGIAGFEKVVALKNIHTHLVEENESAIAMFIDEAKIAAQLSHPNIVHIFEFGKVNDCYFIVMEYVQGKDLGAVLNELKRHHRRIPFEYSALIGMKICQALDYAHRKHDASGKSLGIVHRDVSPKNILISFEGDVKLTDFGVAKATSKMNKTIAGNIKGKISYMSPEQASGEVVDCRSDIFSLGSVLFELATGEKAFQGESDITILDKIRKGEIVPPSRKNPDVPKELESIILNALQYEPDKRFQNALELQKYLGKFIRSYKREELNGRNIVGFMVDLFSDEIKEKDIVIEALKEPQFASKKEENLDGREFSESSSPIADIPRKIEEKRGKILYKLLVADGNVVTQKIVKSAFKKEDFEVQSVSDGQNAIKSIETIRPDVLLLDINLPKKNGYDVCEYIKDKYKLAQPKVILLKEAFEKINKERIQKVAYDDIIQKPFGSAKLVKKVKQMLHMSN